MATSGVVGRTRLDVATLIEKAARKCGIMSSILTSEQLMSARENLYLILTSLSNRGLNLWCVTKRVQPVVQYAQRMRLSLDVVSILNPLYRTGTYTDATSYVGASASVVYTSDTGVVSVSVVAPLDGDYTLVVESSPDGVTWTERGRATIPDVSTTQPIGVDVDVAVEALHWRVREDVLVVTLASATFVSAATEVPMAQLTRDSYTAFPNKTFDSGSILQYFFDKQVPNPQLWLWPVASLPGPQLVLWIQRQIQDPGDLVSTIDVPTRWLNSILFSLSSAICLELPKELVPPDRYKVLFDLAEVHTRSAEDGEIDGAPVRITPGIGVYTR